MAAESIRWRVTLLAVACALVGLPGGAQESSNEATPEDTGATAAATGTTETQPLGDWWTKSATSFDPVPSQWLFHLESTLGFQRLQGNTDGKYYQGALRLTIRKRKLTIYNNYSYTKRDIDYGGDTGSVDLKQVEASLVARRDLLRWLNVIAGADYEVDDTFYIDRRDTTFVGIGVFFEPHAAHTLEGIVAGGRQTTDYLSESAGLASEETDTGWSVAGRWRWKAAAWLTFEAQGRLWEFDEDVNEEQQQGDRYDYTIEATIPLSAHVALSLKHKVKYENNWLVRYTGGEKKDTTQTFGIKLTI